MAVAENVLQNGLFNNDLSVVQQTSEGADSPTFRSGKKRVITHYPPPPYLPGELERRALANAMDADSEVERINARLDYDSGLFHYF